MKTEIYMPTRKQKQNSNSKQENKNIKQHNKQIKTVENNTEQ